MLYIKSRTQKEPQNSSWFITFLYTSVPSLHKLRILITLTWVDTDACRQLGNSCEMLTFDVNTYNDDQCCQIWRFNPMSTHPHDPSMSSPNVPMTMPYRSATFNRNISGNTGGRRWRCDLQQCLSLIGAWIYTWIVNLCTYLFFLNYFLGPSKYVRNHARPCWSWVYAKWQSIP